MRAEIYRYFQDHTNATWIRGEVVQKGVNPGSTMHSATMGISAGSVYQPGKLQVRDTEPISRQNLKTRQRRYIS